MDRGGAVRQGHVREPRGGAQSPWKRSGHVHVCGCPKRMIPRARLEVRVNRLVCVGVRLRSGRAEERAATGRIIVQSETPVREGGAEGRGLTRCDGERYCEGVGEDRAKVRHSWAGKIAGSSVRWRDPTEENTALRSTAVRGVSLLRANSAGQHALHVCAFIYIYVHILFGIKRNSNAPVLISSSTTV